MKTVMSVFVTLFAAFSVQVQSAEFKFVAVDQSVETQICMAVTTNNVKQLKKVLRRHGERLPVVRDTIKCNEVAIADFSEQYGFIQVARLFNADKNVDMIASNLPVGPQ